MSGNGSVVRRRVLGRESRRLRERAGYTLETAAPRLEFSVSKLNRIEVGQQATDVHSIRSMLDLYHESERWDRTRTPHQYSADQWTAFVAGVRAGRFARG